MNVALTNTRNMGRNLVTFYSHPATKVDEWVVETLEGKRNGYFVECGAFDGMYHSDTWTLEKSYGWTGILIEPNPHTFRELKYNRQSCILVPSAVADFEGNAELYISGTWSGLAKYSSLEQLNEYNARGARKEMVPVCKLSSLLEAAPPIIDYLSLDTEGSELEILASYFQDANTIDLPKFRLLTIEFGFDMSKLRRLQDLLGPRGYECVFLRGWDACFQNIVLGEN